MCIQMGIRIWMRIRILLFSSLTFKMPTKNWFKKKVFLLLMVHLPHFSMIKSQKKSQNSRNQCFSNYICVMISGSRSRARAGPGSGSRRPKKMWIRWFVTSFGLFIFEIWCKCTVPSKSNKQKNCIKIISVGLLKVSDENSRIRIRIMIRIHTSMSWIRNTAYNFTTQKRIKLLRVGMSLKQMLNSQN